MCEGPMGLRAGCAGQPGAGRCMRQGWGPWKGHMYHAQEFGHGLRAVTGAFGPGNDRAVCSSERPPIYHAGAECKGAGGRLADQE